MPKTFQQLKLAIQQWLGVDQEDGDERLPISICGDLINWAIREYCRNRESVYGEAQRFFSTVANQRDYSLPARFSKPGQLYYFHPTNGSKVTLALLQKQKFDERYPGSVAYATGAPGSIPGLDPSQILGDPEAYSMWAQKILLAKVPNSIITIFQDYWELPADLSADDDTNAFTIANEQYVIFKALEGAEAFGIEDERMGVWKEQAAKLESHIDSEDARRWVTGRVSQSREPGGR